MSDIFHQSADGKVNSRCIVWLCDKGYLFPTAVTARQAKKWAPDKTDLIVFLDADEIDADMKASFEQATGAELRLMPPSINAVLNAHIPVGFFRTHVTRAAMFRLFVAQLLPHRYDRILYLDGDMQIKQPLGPLFDIALPEGFVGVVPDWAAICSREGMVQFEENRRYLRGLGLSEDQWSSYFNSGMMIADSETWNAIGPVALDFLTRHPDACRLHDQSALNHACRGRVFSVSPRWNFLRQYMPLPAYQDIKPAVVHFVGKIKPWDGAYPPWGKAEFRPYTEMAHMLNGSGIDFKRKPFLRRLTYKIKPLIVRSELSDKIYRNDLNDAVTDLAHRLP